MVGCPHEWSLSVGNRGLVCARSRHVPRRMWLDGHFVTFGARFFLGLNVSYAVLYFYLYLCYAKTIAVGGM
jgi:hypothetical protein